MKLYKFFWDCGRMGCLDGLFFAEESEVQKTIGKQIYFGEVLGKHSEIFGTLKESDIEEVKISQEAVDELYSVFGKTALAGYNPLDYYDPETEEDE